MKVLPLAVLLAAVTASAHAQRAAGTQTPQTSQTAQTSTASVGAASDGETPRATAPQSFKAKYEGGIFGYNRKQDGTLSFDDGSRRLVFRTKKENKELFSIPYDAIVATFPDTRSRTSTGGQIASSIPTPYGIGQVGRLFRTKVRYLTLQFRDADTEVAGTTSFKIGNRQLLESVVPTVAAKAGLVRRGEIYVRRRDTATNTNAF